MQVPVCLEWTYCVEKLTFWLGRKILSLYDHGFLRVRCDSCHAEHLVAFSCTNSRRFRRTPWILPELWARRMAESATLLVDAVLPEQPVRQWVLSFP
jgi:hypothetical protein